MTISCFFFSFICSGYMSPEYVVFGKFSTKSDVFSFGVILFEIITGKKSNGFCQGDSSLSLIGHVSQISFWHTLSSKLLLIILLLFVIVMNYIDMAIMESRETVGNNWFIPKGFISSPWSIEMHPNRAVVRARRCIGQTNHVSCRGNVE